MDNVRIIIGNNRTTIPHLKERIEARKKEWGEKRLEHALIRQQIIALRISYERYKTGHCRYIDYLEKLSYLRQRLRETS